MSAAGLETNTVGGCDTAAAATAGLPPLEHQQPPSPPHGLSKSQQKKLRRREKWLATRGERRKLEREKRKIKRKAAAEERARCGLDQTSLVPKIKLMSESSNKFRVVIDMDFNDYMTEAEMAASAKQVGRVYSLNRHAENPCQLYVSSLAGKVKEKFSSTNTGYENWDCNVSELHYLNLFQASESSQTKQTLVDKKQFVYLTGDAEDDLPGVEEILKDESKIYVIGGLVDHNRHKMLCFERATKEGIPIARLPIAKYVKLSQRSVLSTVTVFEILLKVLGSHKSWPEALLEAIPKRKIDRPIVQNHSDNNSTEPEVSES